MSKFSKSLTLISLSIIFSSTALAKGFLEYNTKVLKNPSTAQDLGHDWSQEQLQELRASLGFDIKVLGNSFKANTFFSYEDSPLYSNDETSSPNVHYLSRPQSLIGRNFFKMISHDNEDSSHTKIVLNQFSYEWGDQDAQFTGGRIIIDYGSGHLYNPINPFNFSSYQREKYNLEQANDGFELKLAKDPNFTIYLYFLADKSYTDFDEQITRTLVLRGAWKVDESLQVNYILGEDLNRHKYGVEVYKNWKKFNAYLQLVKLSQRLDSQKPAAQGLFHKLLGFNWSASNKWKTAIEIGKIEKIDPANLDGSTNTESTNYIEHVPFESFMALSNTYELNDKWKISNLLANDTQTEATISEISVSYKPSNAYSISFNIKSMLAEVKESLQANDKYQEQQLIADEISLGFKAFF